MATTDSHTTGWDAAHSPETKRDMRHAAAELIHLLAQQQQRSAMTARLLISHQPEYLTSSRYADETSAQLIVRLSE